MNNTPSKDRVLDILRSDKDVMALLRAVRDMGSPNAWIGAGCIRNAVWNVLFTPPHPVPPTDIDCIYFDPESRTSNRDRAYEKTFEQKFPGTTWEFINQATVHGMNGDAPYQSVEDALTHWPETATAIAVRLDEKDRLHLLAPYGVDDLVQGRVRKSPKARAESFLRRLNEKRWKEKWPGLTVVKNGDAEAVDHAQLQH